MIPSKLKDDEGNEYEVFTEADSLKNKLTSDPIYICFIAPTPKEKHPLWDADPADGELVAWACSLCGKVCSKGS